MPKRPLLNGGIDSDSDQETKVEIGLNSTRTYGARTTVDKVLSPKKRKCDSSRSVPVMQQAPMPHVQGRKNKDGKRHQGASTLMKAFMDNLDAIQATVLAREFDATVEEQCPCGPGARAAIYHCIDCTARHPSCETCIKSTHRHLPFHRLQMWNGKFFQRASLNDIGFILSLGHGGHQCPNRAASSRGREMVVVDVSGIHQMHIEFCQCRDALTHPFQLLRNGLFPATMDQPQTAFTFSLLKDFHLHTLASKKSAYDHYAALQRHTDNVFPQNTPDRRREFQRVGRVWRALAMMRRAGQAHGIDKILTMRRPGSYAVRCPACIEPGINVSLEELANISPDDIHRYTLFLSADGNFRLQRKIKVDDPDDVALLNGNAYFVETNAYNKYLNKMGIATDDERSTCARLNVVRLQNLLKFKHTVVSGVDGIQCARHGLFWPQGMVDLQKGERFCNTDYALMSALVDGSYVPYIKLSYDIFCQYEKYFLARVAKHFPHMKDIASRIDGLVPKMHIMGHIEACQLQYSFNTTPHVGRTFGETIETAWAEGNQTAGSTKEMNPGHRHDILDDFHGYWNWQKVISLPRLLYRQHTNAAAMYRQSSGAFDGLCNRHGPELISSWSAMDCKPIVINGKVTSVYANKAKKGPPSQSTQLQELLQAEAVSTLSNQGHAGSVSIINDGLRLEAEQARLQKLAQITTRSATEEERLEIGRVKFRNDLDRWRQRQLTAFPALQQYLNLDDDIDPEAIKLLLPSSLNEPTRKAHGLSDVALLEYQLRVGQAHDALRDVRHAVKMFNYNLKFKKSAIFGQGPTTRAQAFLRDIKRDQVSAADKYRRARAALVSLGMLATDAILQPLHDSELWMKDTTKPRQLGDAEKKDPWFWTVAGPSALTQEEQDEWSMESERVKWFRDRADRDRWREEIDVTDQEFLNTAQSHSTVSSAWNSVASTAANRGAAAYALRHSCIYGKLAEDAANLHAQALKKAEESEL